MIKSSLTPPTVDQATVDHYVAKGRRERSRAFAAMIRSLFTAPENLVETAPKAMLPKPGAAT
jgi:hypothetical protein